MSTEQKLRNEMPKEYLWKINDLFATDELWEEKYNAVLNELPQLQAFKGKLSESPENLLQCIELDCKISEQAAKLYVYAHMKLHEDSTNTKYQALANKADSLQTKFSSETSFIRPEILEMDSKRLQDFITSSPAFELYAHFFDNMLRLSAHVLSSKEEKILAEVSELADAPDAIYSMLNNADIDFGTITDSNGQTFKLTHGNFISFMESPDRHVRQNAFNSLYDAYIKQKNTISTIYSSSVKSDVFYAKTRKFNSSLEASLHKNNIPTSVYFELINSVNDHLDDLHNYISLRKKILGIDELHMYDLYVPIIKDIDMQISYEDAKQKVKEALAPMGSDYLDGLDAAFKDGWIDVYENKGKRSGAYSWGTFGCHPFVLLNYDGKLDDMFTLAHELGHAMHSYYSWQTQPYIYSGHPIFLAEVASTVNESLLIRYLLENTTDKKTKAYLLNYFIEQFRRTLFRQTMFAEFEMNTHQMVESGTPLTVDNLCELYRSLNIKYHGKDLFVDAKADMEWSRIPHFYTAFYVYQYATGYSAAIALSKNILENGKEAVDAYKTFLKSGCSNYSIEILKSAGIDMSTRKPIDEALDYFKNLLEQMSNLI